MPTARDSPARTRPRTDRRTSNTHRRLRPSPGTGGDECSLPRRKRQSDESDSEAERAATRTYVPRDAQDRAIERERRRRSKGLTVEKSRNSAIRGGTGGEKSGHKRSDGRRGHAGTNSSSQLLSEDALGKLQRLNDKDGDLRQNRGVKEKGVSDSVVERLRAERRKRKRKKRRIVSGPMLEEGGISRERRSKSKKWGKKFWIIAAVLFVLLIIIVVAAVVAANKKKASSSGAKSSGTPKDKPPRNELKGISEDSIPTSAKGTILDPFTWYDTTNFNVTYTDTKIGGLPVMGLNSQWDDSAQANPNVPPLNKPWSYPTDKIRGVNLGGWLSLEPFITPSLFNGYDRNLNIVDEYTLTQHLGSQAASTLEAHYATFVTESTFKEIAAAGLDHVRIPFSYWAVNTYPDDPYVAKISWRYLLRGIEWARKYGLRIKLDVHGLPGSQNGWNHSGKWGPIGWLNGTDGDINAQRSLEMHDSLAEFFAQPRYQNIITFYGLANEPAMVKIDTQKVLAWTAEAKKRVRAKGINATIVIGDGFLGLQKWAGGLLPDSSGMVLDVHQYVVFNVQQVLWDHSTKIKYACQTWTEQSKQSMDPKTGFGAIMCGEWSQADTDCALNINNVRVGSRWQGNFDQGPFGMAPQLTPLCPLGKTTASQCDCGPANGDPSSYSATYKQWLKMFAEAQMHSFEQGWGWFYWTWDTEQAVQWSYKKGLAAGILPSKAYAPDFKCDKEVPDFGALGLSEGY
ncbi:MAG: hypothetical protein M1814_004759 [Vezdaea aestivalis]|nr:MAG: hypothetical protein M1814_004759 [Vezdaea aestivalis]